MKNYLNFLLTKKKKKSDRLRIEFANFYFYLNFILMSEKNTPPTHLEAVEPLIRLVENLEKEVNVPMEEQIKQLRAELGTGNEIPDEVLKEHILSQNTHLREIIASKKWLMESILTSLEEMDTQKDFVKYLNNEGKKALDKIKRFLPLQNNDFSGFDMLKTAMFNDAIKNIEDKYNSLNEESQKLAKPIFEKTKKIFETIRDFSAEKNIEEFQNFVRENFPELEDFPDIQKLIEEHNASQTRH